MLIIKSRWCWVKYLDKMIKEGKTMKFLVVGLGSMGKRRIRNLLALGISKSKIFGFDTREDRKIEATNKYGISCVDDAGSVIRTVDAVIISTPPDIHLKYQKYAIENSRHFFCEAGVFKEGIKEVLEMAESKNIKAIASKTPILLGERKIIKKLLLKNHIGKPLTFSYHSGNYLPYWHGWEKFSDFYVSKRETGGAREMTAFQLTWLRWAFGEIEKVFCIKGKLSPDFKADIDDIYNLICIFKNGVFGNIIVDVITRPTTEIFELACTNGVLHCNYYYENSVKVKRDGEEEWQTFEVGKETPEKGYPRGEEMYIEEIRDFVDCIKTGKDYGHSYNEELKSIEVLEAAEKSADSGKMMIVN